MVSQKKTFKVFAHYKSMGALCYYGNQGSNSIIPKTWWCISRKLIRIGLLASETILTDDVDDDDGTYFFFPTIYNFGSIQFSDTLRSDFHVFLTDKRNSE